MLDCVSSPLVFVSFRHTGCLLGPIPFTQMSSQTSARWRQRWCACAAPCSMETATPADQLVAHRFFGFFCCYFVLFLEVVSLAMTVLCLFLLVVEISVSEHCDFSVLGLFFPGDVWGHGKHHVGLLGLSQPCSGSWHQNTRNVSSTVGFRGL